eukprot:jgi/Tetstr1/436678/TSEL_025473.t1
MRDLSVARRDLNQGNPAAAAAIEALKGIDGLQLLLAAVLERHPWARFEEALFRLNGDHEKRRRDAEARAAQALKGARAARGPLDELAARKARRKSLG